MTQKALTVITIVGARPQFIKAAVVSRALSDAGIRELLVHTGQHYDDSMSAAIFRDVALRAPDVQLDIGSGTHGEQTGRMVAALERVIADAAPDRVLVYGDTNSTLAGALAAAKMSVPVDHVEAGLRSFDRDMPEELNRILADQLSDVLYCPTQVAVDNLAQEGIVDGVHLVGDVMLDLALAIRDAALCGPLPAAVSAGEYFVATVHRASNTDDAARLRMLIDGLRAVASHVAPVLLPVHPRLRHRLDAAGIDTGGLLCSDPVGYAEMQTLLLHSRGVITDSGGVQKEALFHGIRCITLRDSTEWPETVEAGMNTLVDDAGALLIAARGCAGRVETPPAVLEAFGGGRAGDRIAELILQVGTSRRRWRRPVTVES
jgi:UDP-N-acetylglucosamine 2-epimerase